MEINFSVVREWIWWWLFYFLFLFVQDDVNEIYLEGERRGIMVVRCFFVQLYVVPVFSLALSNSFTLSFCTKTRSYIKLSRKTAAGAYDSFNVRVSYTCDDLFCPISCPSWYSHVAFFYIHVLIHIYTYIYR